MRMKKIQALIAVLALCGNATAVADIDVNALLEAHTHEITLDGEDLSGPGADLIFDLAGSAQFVALGEEHYNFYIPRITTAIFAGLQDQHGFRYFMTEQDPVMMEIMSRKPARGSVDAINDLARRYPMGVTFNSDEELEMLANIGHLSTTEFDPIWGCDQAAGVTHALDQLADEVKDGETLNRLRAKREESAVKERVRDFTQGFFIADADPAWFADIENIVGPQPGTRAEWLIDVLVNANTVFGYYKKGEQGLVPGYYENNRFREEHLKDLCLAKYRQAEINDPYPKALMKFGSWHLYQGLSPTKIHTIGDFFAAVARFNSHEFLSVNFVSMPEDPESSMNRIGYAWPFIKDLDPQSFAIVDLRPFRHYRNRNKIQAYAGDDWLAEYKEDFTRLVYGYDLLFFVGRVKSATFEVVPKAD